jgi:hypothetical protein
MLPIVARFRRDSLAVELDELTDDTVRAENLDDRQDNVGCRDAGRDLAEQLEADDPRDEH